MLPVTQSIPVALLRQDHYGFQETREAVDTLLPAAGITVSRGEKILVKPNLLHPGNGGLICTHPALVRAVCGHLLDQGASVVAGDSPGFGSAAKVAGIIGMAEALADLGVDIVNLGSPKRVKLPFGYSVGLSRHALEADRIVNLPKLKAHKQMRITGAVKNLFGCVTGVRKALLHSRHGDRTNRFESMILEIGQALPPSVHVMDAVVAMHKEGPMLGKPYPLSMLAACESAVALDAVVYGILGLNPDQVPLWREAQARDLPGAQPDDAAFPLLGPEEFDGSGFLIPKTLDLVSFHPWMLTKSAVKRAWARLT